MIKLTKLLSDFLLPKVRDSFMRQFAFQSTLSMLEEDKETDEMIYEAIALSNAGKLVIWHSAADIKRRVRGLKGDEKRSAIIFLVKLEFIYYTILYHFLDNFVS